MYQICIVKAKQFMTIYEYSNQMSFNQLTEFTKFVSTYEYA